MDLEHENRPRMQVSVRVILIAAVLQLASFALAFLLALW